jgi:DNA ligase-4
VSLLDFNTKAVKMLQKEHAMASWDPTKYMQRLHRIQGSLDDATTAFELPSHIKPPLVPKIGSMIQVRHLFDTPDKNMHYVPV